MGAADKKERVAEFERVCRANGLPVTVQRRAVFEVMLDRRDHPTADQVVEAVRKRVPAISRTTVYRILDTFVRLGLINKICHLGSAARFDPKTRPHHHLVCMHCETIIDVEDARCNAVPWPDVHGVGFEIRDYHIHFRGICANCRRKAKEARAAGRQAAKVQAKRAARRRRKRAGGTRKRRA
jgi:Fe2+ or Zn2+ uptake regulation protein